MKKSFWKQPKFWIIVIAFLLINLLFTNLMTENNINGDRNPLETNISTH